MASEFKKDDKKEIEDKDECTAEIESEINFRLIC